MSRKNAGRGGQAPRDETQNHSDGGYHAGHGSGRSDGSYRGGNGGYHGGRGSGRSDGGGHGHTRFPSQPRFMRPAFSVRSDTPRHYPQPQVGTEQGPPRYSQPQIGTEQDSPRYSQPQVGTEQGPPFHFQPRTDSQRDSSRRPFQSHGQMQQGAPKQQHDPQEEQPTSSRSVRGECLNDEPKEQQVNKKKESRKERKQKRKEQTEGKKTSAEKAPSTFAEKEQSTSAEKVPSTSAEKAPSTSAEKAQATSKGKPQGASSVKSSTLVIPKRQQTGIGTVGDKFRVETNFLKLELKNTNAVIFHYDVEINPEVSSKKPSKQPSKEPSRQRTAPKRLLRTIMEAIRRRHFPDRYPAFDGRKNLYSWPKLQLMRNDQLDDTIEITDDQSERNYSFQVSIKLVAKVTIRSLFRYMDNGTSIDTPRGCIQALEVALSSKPSKVSIAAGKSFFKDSIQYDARRELGDGLEVWDGMFHSCVLGWKQIYLNVDVAHKAFPQKMELLEYFRHYCQYRGHGLDQNGMYTATRFLVGLKLEVRVQNGPRRMFTVHKIGPPPKSARFCMGENGPEITVYDYFLREKNYRVEHTNLPCMVQLQGAHFPAELCTIVSNQVLMRKLTEKQTANMVKYAAKPAYERREKIYKIVNQMHSNNDGTMREFGIEIDENFITVDARIIPQPQLTYQNNKTVTPRQGTWDQDKFLDGKLLKNWAVLNLDRYTRPDQIKNLIDNLVNAGKKSGITIYRTDCIMSDDVRMLPKMLKDMKQKDSTLQLVIIILADRLPGIYGRVKRAAEMEVGVLTQCIKSRTVAQRMNISTAQNILLKINTKLNGVNHSLHKSTRFVALTEPTMIIGADVTHPSPDQTEIPSIAGVAASYDEYGYRYMMSFRLQPPKVEIIRDLEEIMMAMFKQFKEMRKCWPRKIFFYRDGVSEGQFLEVLQSELVAIRTACRRTFGGGYEPGITFIVVQKRHHTRFFPIDGRYEVGKGANVPPGTCVDTDITHPTECEFYLVSHASFQGTARPTKYHLLHDDNNLNADELQSLTYHLCHLFARCNRSVSYPAPTYYAHLIAFQARAYMDGRILVQEEMNNLDTARHCGLVKNCILNDSPMFFV